VRFKRCHGEVLLELLESGVEKDQPQQAVKKSRMGGARPEI